MSVWTRVRIVRAVLVCGVVLRAIAWGTAAGLSVLIVAALTDARIPLELRTRHLLLTTAVVAQLVIAVVLLWRDRASMSIGRVALWIEEHHPSLAYTLITAVETREERLLDATLPAPWAATAWRRVARAVAMPIIAALVGLGALLVLPPGAVARVRSPHPGDAIDGTGARARRGRLWPLVARVQPPSYSRQAESTLDEPSDVRALAGSRIVLRGRGDPTGITAVRGADTLAAARDGDDWTITFELGTKPLALRLGDGGVQRIVALEPIADTSPSLELVAPARDSVLRAPHGRIALAADVHDDFGIASATFEYIVSSGEGENFTFKSGTVGAAQPGGTSASFSASLSLDALALKPGDIVHVRAVARDGNVVTGPGVGSSETRALRIARAGEYDTVAVEAAPPSDEDRSLVSERMLIILAEALEKRRPRLARDSVVAESRAIAVDQKRLRRTVGDIVFMRLGGQPSGEETTGEAGARAHTMEDMLARADSATNRSDDPIDFGGGESPVVAVNKPLLEAYNAMWDASTELEIGEPASALPHMRRALAAIQRARQAERVYLRGRPPQVVIDVERARLQGKEKGASSVRAPATGADSALRSRIDRFVRAVELASRGPGSAVDSLLLLRVDALTDAPAFAAALRDAIDALRRGRGGDATAALARARRALAGPSFTRDSIARWGLIP